MAKMKDVWHHPGIKNKNTFLFTKISGLVIIVLTVKKDSEKKMRMFMKDIKQSTALKAISCIRGYGIINLVASWSRKTCRFSYNGNTNIWYNISGGGVWREVSENLSPVLITKLNNILIEQKFVK